jgi:hypothetical protein
MSDPRSTAAKLGLLMCACLMGACLCGCGAKDSSKLSVASQPAPQVQRFHGATGYDVDGEALDRAADLEISYRTWDEIWLDKPQRPLGKMTLQRFLGLLPNLGVGRELAVVLLDKRESPAGVTVFQIMDSVQGELQKRGFKRVLFRLAMSKTAPPIVRDTAYPDFDWFPLEPAPRADPPTVGSR